MLNRLFGLFSSFKLISKIEREKIAILAQYGVIKYFTKPIKFDIFFESIGKILKAALSIDTTPCTLEVHINNNIIFVEIANGLNREKIAILKYKLSEIIEHNDIDFPKIVLMMTGLTLNFTDGANLEYLLDSLIADTKIHNRNIKILSFDDFTKELVAGHKNYDGIEVAKSLTEVMSSLVDNNHNSDLTDLIADKILTPDEQSNVGSMEIRFSSDLGITQKEAEESTTLKVAIIDDDAVTLNVLKTAFATVNAAVNAFSAGSEFIKSIATQSFDLVILDIFMPGISGFDILQQLQTKNFTTPILIYSQATQRESVLMALKLGAKSYLVKPQKPMDIVQKAMELISLKKKQNRQ